MGSNSPPTRAEFVEVHRDYVFRKFRCSGSCGVVVEALAGSQLWCGQPGCRGSMKPSYPVSGKRLANDQFEAAHRRAQTPRSTPRFSQLFRSEKCPRLVGASGTSGGDEGALLRGIAIAQELLMKAWIDGAEGHWYWTPGEISCHDDA
jgi:hypothetical protein